MMICELCFHHCHLHEGQTGFCHIRMNQSGKNVSCGYGWLTSMAWDPIEKKPFKRFFPGSYILSVGSFGCNLTCPFCQNHTISQIGKNQAHAQYYEAKSLVQLADRSDNLGIAFTYNEPLINYEYIIDCAKKLKKIHKKCLVVTNGCVSPAIIDTLLPYVDAWNIDCKGFCQSCYNILNGCFQDVQYAIEKASGASHVEVTSLIVPGINDDLPAFKEEINWLASIDRDIPLHITRYFPRFHYDKKATSLDVLHSFYHCAKEKLTYVYLGNC